MLFICGVLASQSKRTFHFGAPLAPYVYIKCAGYLENNTEHGPLTRTQV